MQLRVVPPASIDPGCRQGCSRRTILRGLAVAAASVVVAACQTDDTGLVEAGPPGVAMRCGTSLCLDLNDPANAALQAVDGALIVHAPADTIIVVRTSPTEVHAVSDVCTHAECGVGYDRDSGSLACPCHGSRFKLTGEVLQGPAIRALTRYQSQLDLNANRVTIQL